MNFKARLVAKGFTQRSRLSTMYFASLVDNETFAPVAREESINVARALVAEKDL